MGDRDRTLLKAAGLSMSRAASILGITRQTLHERVSNSHSDYLDEKRLAQIYLSLYESDNQEDKDKSCFLADTARNKYNLNLEVSADAQIRSVWDYYLIFATRPLELEDPSYLEFMTKHIYTKARVIAYFIGFDSQIELLIEEIKNQKARATIAWESEVYIIKTNFVDLLPHLGLRRDRRGDWVGEIYDISDSSKFYYLTDTYVSRLTRALRLAGFLFQTDSDPKSFFPSTGDEVSYRGLTFQLCSIQKD